MTQDNHTPDKQTSIDPEKYQLLLECVEFYANRDNWPLSAAPIGKPARACLKEIEFTETSNQQKTEQEPK